MSVIEIFMLCGGCMLVLLSMQTSEPLINHLWRWLEKRKGNK